MSASRNLEEFFTPIHPGEFLRENFMKPLGLSARKLAAALHVPASRISAITRERRGINAEMALRLAQFFSMTPDFWMNMQTRYELEKASDLAEQQIVREVQPGPHLKTQTKQEMS